MLGMAKKRPGSRHKDRHMVALPGDLYDLLRQLSEREDRPIRHEIMRAIRAHLRANGLLPPPGPSPKPTD